MASTTDYMRAAAQRAEVLLTRNGRQERVRLLYWPGDNPRSGSTRWRAKVQTSTGAIFVVDVGCVELLNVENIVADEIDDDTKYRNFRGLRPGFGPSEACGAVPAVRGAASGTQSRLGCEQDEPNYVA